MTKRQLRFSWYISIPALALLLFGMVRAVRAQTGTDILYDTVGTQAYVYGVPLVEVYKYLHLQVIDPQYPGHTPFNKFRHIREAIVIDDPDLTVPNADTLYSYAWLHLADEPMVIHVPAIKNRYYSLLLMDFYSDAITYIGTRVTGTDEGYFIIGGPDWEGSLPREVREIVRRDWKGKLRAEWTRRRQAGRAGKHIVKPAEGEDEEAIVFLDRKNGSSPTLGYISSPTPIVFILGRVLVFNHEDDLPTAHAFQDEIRIFPLSSWGSWEDYPGVELGGFPPYDLTDPLNFFSLLQFCMELNPPPAHDGSVVNMLAQINLAPGQDFDPGSLSDPLAGILRGTVDKGQAIIDSYFHKRGYYVGGGWGRGYKIGRFGSDMYMRAAVVATGPGGNLEEESVYYKAIIDEQFGLLTGQRNYEITVTEEPPMNELGFWSVTMYDPATEQLVPNAAGRYAIGDRTEGLVQDPNGAFTIYVQEQPPESNKVNNWLPAPAGNFYLLWRNYLSKAEVLDGTWKPPAIRRIP